MEKESTVQKQVITHIGIKPESTVLESFKNKSSFVLESNRNQQYKRDKKQVIICIEIKLESTIQEDFKDN